MISKVMIDKLIDQIKIIYKGEELLHDQFLDAYLEFMASCAQRNLMRCLILHPGTELSTILGLILFTLSNLYEDMLNREDVIQSLDIGNKVIISDKKEYLAIFKGMEYVDSVNKDMAVFEMGDGKRKFLSPSSYYKITPYYGNAKTLGGRGIGKNLSLKKNFYAYIMSEDEQKINSVLYYSTVIVCERELADSIMNNVQIVFDEEKPVRLCELFAGAYYTQNDMTSYAGNSYGFEPVLKFTSRMSIARELILEDNNCEIKNLFVCDEVYLYKNISELTGLLERNTLQHICMFGEIIKLPGYDLLQRYADLRLFASTPQALKSFEIQFASGGINSKFNKLIKAIIEPKFDLIYCTSPLDINKYIELKKTLYILSKIDDLEMKQFVVTTYSLLKLFTLSIFPISHVEKVSKKQEWEYINPNHKLSYIKSYSDECKGNNQEEVRKTSGWIEEFYNEIYYENAKFQYIFDYVISDNYQRKIKIVVPKAYYKEIFNYSFQGKNRRYIKNVEILTVTNLKKVDSENDIVILCGVFGDQEAIFLQSMHSYEFKILAYDYEKTLLKRLEQNIERMYSLYDSRNELMPKDMSLVSNQTDIEDEDNILDDFIEGYEISAMTTFAVQLASNTSSNLSEVHKIVNFASGETAFLTQQFEAYVLNRESGEIEEKSVSELVDGDELIFAIRNSHSKDMVKVLLEKIILSERCPDGLDKIYEKSIYWKNVLKQYMEDQNITYRELSAKMNQFGKRKHEVTLRTWLNEDTHIVGPRDEESFYEIALLTEDQEMLESPESFCEACKEIRSMRTRILKYIAKYAFGKAGRKGKDMDVLLKDIIGDGSDVIQIYQIVQIMNGKNKDGEKMLVPSYFTNKPQVRS